MREKCLSATKVLSDLSWYEMTEHTALERKCVIGVILMNGDVRVQFLLLP